MTAGGETHRLGSLRRRGLIPTKSHTMKWSSVTACIQSMISGSWKTHTQTGELLTIFCDGTKHKSIDTLFNQSDRWTKFFSLDACACPVNEQSSIWISNDPLCRCPPHYPSLIVHISG
jgi:hypothetical protein